MKGSLDDYIKWQAEKPGRSVSIKIDNAIINSTMLMPCCLFCKFMMIYSGC